MQLDIIATILMGLDFQYSVPLLAPQRQVTVSVPAEYIIPAALLTLTSVHILLAAP